MRLKNKLFASFFIFGMSSLLCSVAFADVVGGVFMVVKGDIKISSKAGKTEPAKVGTKVTEGDTVQAGHDSRAKIVMADKNVFNISPDTKMVIEKSQSNGNSKNVELKVEFGKVRASVEQKYDGDKSNFNIRTPTAVAGVRGTDFMMGYDSKTRISQIVTFSGMVAVGQPGPGGTIASPVYVPPGHMTQVSDVTKPPEAPKPVPASDLKQMNQDTKTDAKLTTPAATTSTAAKTPVAAPAAPVAASSSAPPSMISSSDLGPDLSNTVNVRGPASVPGVSPVTAIPPSAIQPPPQSTFLNNAIKSQNAILSVTIKPQ